MSLGPITSYSIPFKVPGSQQDRQKLHFFCVQGVSDLSGNLCGSTHFWRGTALESSHEEPVVRQALTAFSSAHLDFLRAKSDERVEDFVSVDTIRAYHKALRCLRRYLASRNDSKTLFSLKVPLICCAFFYCFESTRGNYAVALSHLDNGLAILRSHNSKDTDTSVDVDLSSVSHLFSRLDLQATLANPSRIPTLEITTEAERSGLTPIIPEDYSFPGGTAEAQVTLDKLQNYAWRFLVGSYCHGFSTQVPPEVLQEKADLKSQFSRWDAALDRLCAARAQKAPHTKPDLVSGPVYNEVVTLLRISHRSTLMALDSILPADSSVFSAIPNPQGNEILTFVESLQLTDLGKRAFSAEVGALAPLSMLAQYCADPAVAGRARELLRGARRREGFVDCRFGPAEPCERWKQESRGRWVSRWLY